MYPSWGGGITNSKVVTEKGKYSLDAVQNNPDVEGTLRNGLENVSGKVDSQIINAWNDFDINTNGYIKLIRVKVLKSYAPYPLRFIVNGRGFNKPTSLIVLFKDVDSNDPDINKCTYDAEFTGIYTYKFYIVKEATSTWNIYVSHIAWTSVAVMQAEIFQMKNKKVFEVTYPNALVDSLPDGALEFTQAT